MKKVGRNDPCPCGSGKKYKKCHGASNVIALTPEPYNQELDKLHEGLVHFAMNEFKSELAEIYDLYPEYELSDDEDLLDSYLSGVTIWAILHEPIVDGQTIFDRFYQKEKGRIKHERVRQAFQAWEEVVPSIYLISSYDEEKTYLIDQRTGTEYTVPRMDMNKYQLDTFVLGILLPYIQEYSIAYMLSGLEEVDVRFLADLSDEQLIEDFPFILGEVLIDDASIPDLEWEKIEHKQVADLFIAHATEKGADEDLLTNGLSAWMLYVEKKDPIIRKPEAYAAALEYFIQTDLLIMAFQSQKDLAQEYGVSTTTISKHRRDMVDVLAGHMQRIQPQIDEEMEIPTFTSEKMLRDIDRLLQDKEFESEEELYEFLESLNQSQNWLPPDSDSPREQAQDLLFEAYEATGRDQRRLVEEALALYPNSPDAYLIKAVDAKTVNERYQLVHQAVVAGEKDLGEEFIEAHKEHFWMMPETRPYMRAKEALAYVQVELNDKNAAIATCEEMLELNPSDNQGMRFFLLTLYLEESRFDDASKLIEIYPDDTNINFIYNNCLLHYYRDGLTEKTLSLLKEAHERNPYVKEFLAEDKPFPRVEPRTFGIGDESEAYIYLRENSGLWLEAFPLVQEMKKL